MMVSVAAVTDICGDAVTSTRCIPLCASSSHCAYSRNDSQMTSSSSCSDVATTSGETDAEFEQFSPPSPHPAVLAFGRLFAPHDFEIHESLGEGFFSYVHKVRVRSTGEFLVLKVAKDGGSSRRGEHLSIGREMAMLRRLSHPNVLGLKGVCVERSKFGWDVHLLTDYCCGGSLQRLILDAPRTISWPERASYALDISNAMQYIHSQRIIHRDLTSMNVLLQTRPSEIAWDRAVVSDFGLSCEFPKTGEVLAQVGTTYYMAPECLNEEYYDEKCDVFSFGIILCQLIARIDADPDAGLHRTSRFGLNYVLFASYCPPDTPIPLLKLAFKCCLMNPASRPTFAQIFTEIHSMKIRRAPSPESFRRLQKGGISRSRSDATLRQQMRVRSSLRKTNRTIHSIHPVTEGQPIDFEPVGARVSEVELVARGVAEAESARSAETANPFLGHERFRRERKIVPQRDATRRRSETKHEDGSRPAPSRLLFRRCSSLPSGMEQIAASECSDCCDSAGPGGMPIAFRDWDLTFIREVKTMKRFPSRRHTLSSAMHKRRDGDADDDQDCAAETSSLSAPSRTSSTLLLDTLSERSGDQLRALSRNSFACPLSDQSSLASFNGATGDRLNNNPAKRKATWPNENEPIDGNRRKAETFPRLPSVRCDPRSAAHQKCAIL